MALGFSVLRNETLKLLNETNASVVGELATGVGGTATVASDATILDYLIEGSKEMARTCCYDQSTIQIASTTARLNSYAQSVVWYPQIVSIASTVLTHCGEHELQAFNSNYLNTTGTPLYWYRAGPYHVGLYPKPSTGVVVDITGAAIPPVITTSSGTYSFAPDDILLKALPAYAAAKIAMKNYDDPSLVGRAFWKDWYDMSRMTLWAQLDTSYKAPGALFAIPPVAPSGK
jgi:hypothetical protein